MAVTADQVAAAVAVRKTTAWQALGDEGDAAGDAQRANIAELALALVGEHVDVDSTPDAAVLEAATRCAGWLLDAPTSAVRTDAAGVTYAGGLSRGDPLISSGASAVLRPYHKLRFGKASAS